MKASSAKVVFFGTASFSLPVLLRLHQGGYTLVGVVTKPDAPAGRGRQVTPSPVAEVAARLGVKVLKPRKVADINSELISLGADIGVVAAYGKLLPPSTLDIFPAGLVNVHPSLLPQYRGPSPVATAILDGVKQTGVTIMAVTGEMDAGGIYARREITLAGQETTLALTERLFKLGAKLLIDCLGDTVRGKLQPQPQDDAQATSTKLFSKADAELNWQEPAIVNERRVRAFAGWLDPHASVGRLDIVITQASVLNASGVAGDLLVTEDGQLAVYCAQDALVLESIKPAGKPAMSGRDFLNGYRHKLGLR